MRVERHELLAILREEGKRVIAALPYIQMFAFGSVLRPDTWPADVDLLVVYESAGDPCQVRKLLEPLSSSMPLHVLFLSSDEEAQLGFVDGEKCVPLW